MNYLSWKCYSYSTSQRLKVVSQSLIYSMSKGHLRSKMNEHQYSVAQMCSREECLTAKWAPSIGTSWVKVSSQHYLWKFGRIKMENLPFFIHGHFWQPLLNFWISFVNLKWKIYFFTSPYLISNNYNFTYSNGLNSGNSDTGNS